MAELFGILLEWLAIVTKRIIKYGIIYDIIVFPMPIEKV